MKIAGLILMFFVPLSQAGIWEEATGKTQPKELPPAEAAALQIRRQADELKWTKQEMPIAEDLLAVRCLMVTGKTSEADRAWRKLKSKAAGLPAWEALGARLELQEALKKNGEVRRKQMLEVAHRIEPLADFSGGGASRTRHQAWLVALRANQALAWQASPEARKLLKDAPWLPTFQGLPWLQEKPALAVAQADWSSLLQLAEQGAKSFAEEDQLEAALLTGDALMLRNDIDKALAAYDFGLGQAKYWQHQFLEYKRDARILSALTSELSEHRQAALKIQEQLKLSMEFLLWRQAETQRLSGQLKNAVIGYDQLLAQCALTRKESLATEKAAASDKVKDKEVQGATPEKGASASESPFQAAAFYHRAECLLHLALTAKERQLQITGIELFLKSQPYGLYRGRARLLLLENALAERDLKTAARRSAQLTDWLQEVRDKKIDWKLSQELCGAAAAAAGGLLQGPQQEWLLEGWKRPRRSQVPPGQMVNEASCPWLMLDLRDWSARYQGFFAFAEGKYDIALSEWTKILALDADCREGDIRSDANDYTRLRRSIEMRRIIALPEEHLFSGDDKRLVLLAEFWYITQRFDLASALVKELLEGPMDAPKKDYLWALLSQVESRAGRRDQSLICLAKVIDDKELNSFTRRRCAFQYANLILSYSYGGKEKQAAGRAMLEKLCKESAHEDFTCMAHILLAKQLYEEKRDVEGAKVLDWLSRGDKGYIELAERMKANKGHF